MMRSQILLMFPLLTVKLAYLVVNQDESQKLLSGININSEVTTAFYAQNNHKTQNQNSKCKGKKPDIECDYCHLPGHKRDTCYNLNGYPIDFQFTEGKNNTKVLASTNQMQSQSSNSTLETLNLPYLLDQLCL